MNTEISNLKWDIHVAHNISKAYHKYWGCWIRMWNLGFYVWKSYWWILNTCILKSSVTFHLQHGSEGIHHTSVTRYIYTIENLDKRKLTARLNTVAKCRSSFCIYCIHSSFTLDRMTPHTQTQYFVSVFENNFPTTIMQHNFTREHFLTRDCQKFACWSRSDGLKSTHCYIYRSHSFLF